METKTDLEKLQDMVVLLDYFGLNKEIIIGVSPKGKDKLDNIFKEMSKGGIVYEGSLQKPYNNVSSALILGYTIHYIDKEIIYDIKK